MDRVLLLNILEHLRSPERIPTECHTLLDSDGQLIVSLPNLAFAAFWTEPICVSSRAKRRGGFCGKTDTRLFRSVPR